MKNENNESASYEEYYKRGIEFLKINNKEINPESISVMQSFARALVEYEDSRKEIILQLLEHQSI